MPEITIEATGSSKFIQVTDVLTLELFGPKDVKLSTPWKIKVGAYDEDPKKGRIDINVARENGGPYLPHKLDMLVENGKNYKVDDTNLP